MAERIEVIGQDMVFEMEYERTGQVDGKKGKKTKSKDLNSQGCIIQRNTFHILRGEMYPAMLPLLCISLFQPPLLFNERW
jgi:hypothetical protein